LLLLNILDLYLSELLNRLLMLFSTLDLLTYGCLLVLVQAMDVFSIVDIILETVLPINLKEINLNLNTDLDLFQDIGLMTQLLGLDRILLE
jgi:hypothetical protein